MGDPAGRRINWTLILGWVLTLAALAFVVRWLWQVDHRVWGLLRTFDVKLALLSLLVFQIWFTLRFIGWHVISRWYGLNSGASSNIKMWTLSELMRYIPGNVWSFAARFRGARDRGVSRGGATIALALEACNLMMGAAVVAAWFWRPDWWWLWILASVVFIFGLPTGLKLLAKWRKWEQQHQLTFLQTWQLYALYVLVWLSYGLAQSIIIAAIPGISTPSITVLIGVNVAAWLLGYVSFVTPMGLGVREVAFVSLLRHSLVESVATLLAVLTRVWLVICELVFLGLVLIISRRR